jgi:hypothetical protein
MLERQLIFTTDEINLVRKLARRIQVAAASSR